MSDIVIDRVRPGDLTAIMRDFERFWGDRELLRALHHPMFFCEFAETALVARRGAGDTSEIAGYLLGFVAPAGYGCIHLVAVRDDARGLGLGRRLYQRFAATAAQHGATALKAITSPENEGSIAFHRRMGFAEITLDPDYLGSGRPRVIMRRLLEPGGQPGPREPEI